MPPNSVEVSVVPDPSYSKQDKVADFPKSVPNSNSNYGLQIFQASVNLTCHILIGGVVAICLIFSFRNGVPLNVTSQHIVLCVIGYQLLMAEAFLSLAPENGWSAKLTLMHKRRAHWILQLVGSVLAIAGSVIMMQAKTVNFDTLHGIFGLVAMVFSTVSLVNGLTSLYAYELRRFLPGNLSKLTHICFGTIAFATSSISLCYGFDKFSFRSWSSDGITIACIVFTAIFTFICIFSPILTFGRKSLVVLRK